MQTVGGVTRIQPSFLIPVVVGSLAVAAFANFATGKTSFHSQIGPRAPVTIRYASNTPVADIHEGAAERQLAGTASRHVVDRVLRRLPRYRQPRGGNDKDEDDDGGDIDGRGTGTAKTSDELPFHQTVHRTALGALGLQLRNVLRSTAASGKPKERGDLGEKDDEVQAGVNASQQPASLGRLSGNELESTLEKYREPRQYYDNFEGRTPEVRTFLKSMREVEKQNKQPSDWSFQDVTRPE